MNIEEALTHADDCRLSAAYYKRLEDWRVACITLAAEVRRLRGDEALLRQALEALVFVSAALDADERDVEEVAAARRVIAALRERLE